MKQKMLSMLLALCMVLSLGAGALADGEELNDYQLTGTEMAALGETLSGCDPMTVDNAFFHIVMTYEQTSKSQTFTYAEAIADVLAAEGTDALSAMFGIGDEEELEAVAAISGWLEEQQMDEERAAGFFQSLSDGMNWPTDAYEAFSEEIFPTEADPAAPIEFDIDPLNMDENGAIPATAAVPADGYYLFAASLSPMGDTTEFTFASDLPIQTDGAAIPFDTLPTGVLRKNIGAAVELTAGDYTVAIGSAYYDAKLILPQTADSLEGSFAPGSAYVCALAQPVTVSFTMDATDAKEIHFFGGAGGALLQDLAPAVDAPAGQSVTFTVDFPAGVAVIDASSDLVTGPVTGTVS